MAMAIITHCTTFAGSVATVDLAGAAFGNQAESTCVSKEKIEPASRYKISISGTCHGTGSLNTFVPNGTKISALMDKIAPQSSLYLNGIFDNPEAWSNNWLEGSLPTVLVDENISGKEDLGLFGEIAMSIRLKVQILIDGTVVLSIRNSKIQSDYFQGNIVFEPGAKLVVSGPRDQTNQVSLRFGGQSIGNRNKSFRKNSGLARMLPSKRISYDVLSTCTATGDFKKIIPSKINFAKFLDQFSIKNSGLLKGEFVSKSNTFPVVICNKKFSGSGKFKKLGRVAISFRQIIKIADDGTVTFSISEFSARSIGGKLDGEIRFSKNSYVKLQSAPEFEIESSDLKSDEGSEVAYVKIRRSGSLNKQLSVRVFTTNITAVAGRDYISRNEIITFAIGKSEYVMPIVLVNNNYPDAGLRRFKVSLINPSPGATLGDCVVAVVTIADDDF